MQAMVVGVPGTGKTYFMVAYLKKYFEYDEFFREYAIKKDYLILTNIAGLQFYGAACWNIESPEILGCPSDGVKGKYTREQFFTVPNMQAIMDKTGKKNIILVVDEIQRKHYFPKGYDHADVMYLLEYHRHIGMDIIFGTQNVNAVSRGALNQCEYLAHGKLRSKKIFGAMSYRFTDNAGGYMYDKTMRTDKTVFNAYQSASVVEANKPKSALLQWAVVTVIFLCIAGGLFKTALAIVAGKAKGRPAEIQKARNPVVPAPVPVAVVSAALPALAKPIQGIVSSGKIVAVAPVPVSPAAVVALPHVIGYVGYVSGKSKRYLLSTGQTIICKRSLNIGDIYTR